MSVRGLEVYKANGHALAERALVAAYPVLAQMLGDESFSALARALWHATPPQCGDMAQWGDTLAEFVAASVQLLTEEVLLQMVRQLHAETGLSRLVMAGGVALNSVARRAKLPRSPARAAARKPATKN